MRILREEAGSYELGFSLVTSSADENPFPCDIKTIRAIGKAGSDKLADKRLRDLLLIKVKCNLKSMCFWHSGLKEILVALWVWTGLSTDGV